ncbi:MAG: restriction endonuclease subunit S [Magnetospirillum sp.]|nr:restriction endonuclease subunit S [Magnetospirillum sp.]
MKRSIGDVADFIRGITFKPEDRVTVGSSGSVVCMRTKNIQKDLDVSDLLAVPENFVRNQIKILSDGDILLSSANSWGLVGKCCYVDVLDYKATAGGFISIVRAKSGAFPRFLYHWLNSPEMQHSARHCGRQTTNISNLDVNRYLKLPFPDLSYDEQRRMAAILDKADAIRRKRQQALALADDFLRSAFLEMFGDPVTNPNRLKTATLGAVAEFISGGTPSKERPDYWNGSFPWVSPKDMKRERIDSAEDGLTDLVFSETSLKKIPVKTVLIVVRGMILTHTVPVALSEVPLTINQDMKGIRFKPSVLPEFGLWCLKVQHANMLAKIDTAAHGTKRFDMDHLKALPILVPGRPEQERFVRAYEAFHSFRSREIAASLEDAALFASLSQRAFRGEL